MQELSCLRAKLWFLADDNEHAMREPPSNLLSLCQATNIAFIIQPVKKKDTSKPFKGQIRCGGFWGARVNLTSRDLTDLKVLL